MAQPPRRERGCGILMSKTMGVSPWFFILPKGGNFSKIFFLKWAPRIENGESKIEESGFSIRSTIDSRFSKK
jgi:hypothetical protein